MLEPIDFPSRPSLISSAEFCAEAGLSLQALNKALAAQRIFAVELQGQRLIPRFFLEEKFGRRRLASICKTLGNLPGGSKLQFFTTSKGSLGGRTPLDTLADGNLAAVRVAARGFLER